MPAAVGGSAAGAANDAGREEQVTQIIQRLEHLEAKAARLREELNRLMTHVDTIQEPRIGAAGECPGEYDFIAVFQCSKVPSHRRHKAFEPSGF